MNIFYTFKVSIIVILAKQKKQLTKKQSKLFNVIGLILQEKLIFTYTRDLANIKRLVNIVYHDHL